MSLSVCGESVYVAVKHYTELTTEDAVVDEGCLLSQISHEAFPFVFGVVFSAVCTIGMVWGVVFAKAYGTMAL